MKAKFIILTPVYNDWKNLSRLLAKINNIFKNEIKKKFDLVVINDCSIEKFNFKRLKMSKINKITIISLPKNLGSQRALAIGIKYINKKYKNNFKTIIIDSDGQDNPIGIKKLIYKNKVNPNYSIMVNRGQRKEPLWFIIFYEIYSFLINLFTFKKIRYGNFCLLNNDHVKDINFDNNLWSALPPTISNNVKRITYITLDREKRYTGNSKMNFIGLLLHALKVFSVLRYRFIFSSMLYLFISYIFFLGTHLFNLILFLIMISNIIIFLIPFLYRINYRKISKKLKIKII